MTQLGSSPLNENFGVYRFNINVQPYPELDKEIKDGDYRLEISVSR